MSRATAADSSQQAAGDGERFIFTSRPGGRFRLDVPRVEDVDVRAIAHSLAYQCRWTAHCLRFYSVAQHSVFVSRRVPASLALWGLIHDASEAWVGDNSSPLKALIPAIKEKEREVMDVVLPHFGLAWTDEDVLRYWTTKPPEVGLADRRAMVTEAKYLLPEGCWGRIADEVEADPYPDVSGIECWSPEVAEGEFLRRLWELWDGRTQQQSAVSRQQAGDGERLSADCADCAEDSELDRAVCPDCDIPMALFEVSNRIQPRHRVWLCRTCDALSVKSAQSAEDESEL